MSWACLTIPQHKVWCVSDIQKPAMHSMWSFTSYHTCMLLISLAAITPCHVEASRSIFSFSKGIPGLRRLSLQRPTRGLLLDGKDWELIKAARSNKPKEVSAAIENGADINAQDFYGFTPLHWAAFRAATDSAKELIAQGADIELQSTNFLWFDGLSMPSGSTPLYVASSLNRVQIAQALIARGAKVTVVASNSWSPVHRAAELGQAEVLRVLVDSTSERVFLTRVLDTPLHIAAFKGKQKAASVLLEAGFEKEAVNDNKDTALHRASGNFNNGAMVKFLSEKGCNPNAQNKEGWTPLHKAAWTHQDDGLQALIDNGGDMEIANIYGETALHIAAARGHLPSVKVLLSKGANKSALSDNGKTVKDFICSKVGSCPDRAALENLL